MSSSWVLSSVNFDGSFLTNVLFLVTLKVLHVLGKGKVHPRTVHEGPEEEQIYSSTLPSTSALEWGWVVNATPRPLYPRERPSTHCVGGWVGRSGRVRRISPPPGFYPRTVQPVASRYTDCANSAGLTAL